MCYISSRNEFHQYQQQEKEEEEKSFDYLTSNGSSLPAKIKKYKQESSPSSGFKNPIFENN